MTYRYVTGNIDGKWYSSSLGREYSSSMSESLTDLDSKELEKYFTDTAVTMKVKGSNAKVTASYTFDKKKNLMKLLKKLRKTVIKSMIRRQAKQRQPFSKGRLAV